MAAIDSLSSWGPQANSQFPPPMAQAPKPMEVKRRSEFPSRRSFCEEKVIMTVLGCGLQRLAARSTLPSLTAHHFTLVMSNYNIASCYNLDATHKEDPQMRTTLNM